MKYWAYALASILLLGAVSNAYAENTWYSGKNVQEGLLMKYRISHIEITNSKPVDVTLWFKGKDDNGNWLTFVLVQAGSKVTHGTIRLSSIDLTPIGFVDDPALGNQEDMIDDLKTYKDLIKRTLGWLAGEASKDEPKSLDVGAVWGIPGALGGGSSPITVSSTTTLTLADKSWEVSTVTFRVGGGDNTFWVNRDFPSPLKAKLYVQTVQQPLPVEFEYELVETRITDTQPEIPQGAIELPKSPLIKKTTSGSFTVELYWKPEMIEPSVPIQMATVFRDQSGNLVNDAQYNIEITDKSGNTLFKKENVVTEKGQGKHLITFNSTGTMHITITYLGSVTLFGPEHVVEKAEFDLVVVPEFPVAIIVMIVTISAVIAVTRFGKIAMPKLT